MSNHFGWASLSVGRTGNTLLFPQEKLNIEDVSTGLNCLRWNCSVSFLVMTLRATNEDNTSPRRKARYRACTACSRGRTIRPSSVRKKRRMGSWKAKEISKKAASSGTLQEKRGGIKHSEHMHTEKHTL